jgi:hypothetical protein
MTNVEKQRQEEQRRNMLIRSALTLAEHRHAKDEDIAPLVDARDKAALNVQEAQSMFSDAREAHQRAVKALAESLKCYIDPDIADLCS